jgi:hypothetical protein
LPAAKLRQLYTPIRHTVVTFASAFTRIVFRQTREFHHYDHCQRIGSLDNALVKADDDILPVLPLQRCDNNIWIVLISKRIM